MTSVLDLSEDHAGILRAVLRAYLPEGARAFVFGSRAHGGARRYSDLDLAIEWDRPLGLDLLSRIAEALSDPICPGCCRHRRSSNNRSSLQLRITADCILFEAAPLAARSGDNQ